MYRGMKVQLNFQPDPRNTRTGSSDTCSLPEFKESSCWLVCTVTKKLKRLLVTYFKSARGQTAEDKSMVKG